MNEEVTTPIHPKESFDMIVGTSTGGIIAFSLLAGNKDEEGKRTTMTVDEVKKFYEE